MSPVQDVGRGKWARDVDVGRLSHLPRLPCSPLAWRRTTSGESEPLPGAPRGVGVTTGVAYRSQSVRDRLLIVVDVEVRALRLLPLFLFLSERHVLRSGRRGAHCERPACATSVRGGRSGGLLGNATQLRANCTVRASSVPACRNCGYFRAWLTGASKAALRRCGPRTRPASVVRRKPLDVCHGEQQHDGDGLRDAADRAREDRVDVDRGERRQTCDRSGEKTGRSRHVRYLAGRSTASFSSIGAPGDLGEGGLKDGVLARSPHQARREDVDWRQESCVGGSACIGRPPKLERGG